MRSRRTARRLMQLRRNAAIESRVFVRFPSRRVDCEKESLRQSSIVVVVVVIVIVVVVVAAVGALRGRRIARKQ